VVRSFTILGEVAYGITLITFEQVTKFDAHCILYWRRQQEIACYLLFHGHMELIVFYNSTQTYATWMLHEQHSLGRDGMSCCSLINIRSFSTKPIGIQFWDLHLWI